MEKIVPVKELVAVITQLRQEGYTSIVVVPLTLRKVACYAQPKLCLGENSTHLEDGSFVVKEYHVVAHKPMSLWGLLKGI